MAPMEQGGCYQLKHTAQVAACCWGPDATVISSSFISDDRWLVIDLEQLKLGREGSFLAFHERSRIFQTIHHTMYVGEILFTRLC